MPSTGESDRSETTSLPNDPTIPSPYVSPTEAPAEATLKATLAGIVFGVLFGAANAYLGLRAGLTISTSIPVAVMSVAFFRALRAGGVESTILEANLSQTVGSASSSVASGVIFTLPALFLWGFDTTLVQITLLAMSGGLLGVLFMIPLRSYLIVREHPNLPYPEGTACAEVLKASQAGGGRARNVFVGLGVGAVLKGLTGWIRAVPDELQVSIPFLRKGQLGSAVSPALLGVGYILGLRVAAIMVGGGLLSWLVIIPTIAWWGEGRMEPLYPETALTITQMSPSLIWTRYVRYIGAGAVASGGLITLVRSVPTMIESFRIGSRQILRERSASSSGGVTILRTDQDLSLSTVGIGACIVFGVLAFVPLAFSSIEIPAGRALAALLVVVFAFFFVTVSSRIVGLVGVTSNPTSGMTIATLLGTSSLFFLLGWTDDAGKVAALTVGAVVAIAAIAELLRIPSLPFAVGVYLPVSTMFPVFLGGLLRTVLERQAATGTERHDRRNRGVLFGSGLVGGEGLIGVVIAGAAGYAVSRGKEPWSLGYEWAGAAAEWCALALLVGLVMFYWHVATSRADPGRTR